MTLAVAKRTTVVSSRLKPARGAITDQSHPHLRGRIGWWAIREGGGGAIYDNIVGGRRLAGSISGATWTGGAFGSALSFDGVDDYVDFSNAATPFIPATADWTILGRFHNTSASSLTILAQYLQVSGNGRFLIRRQNANLLVFLGNQGSHPTVEITAAGVNSDIRNYFAVTRSGALFSVYVNGGTAVTQTDSDATRSILQTGNILGGRTTSTTTYNTSLTDFLTGRIEEIAVFDRALDQPQIRSIFLDPWGPFRRRRAALFIAIPPTIVTPSPVSASWSTVAPALTRTLAASPASASWSSPAPSLAKTISMAVASAAWSIAAPAISSTVSPSPVVATWSIAAPSIQGPDTFRVGKAIATRSGAIGKAVA